MATKLEKCATRVNDAFTDKLKAAFAAKFNRELETNYSIFAMALISQPAAGEPFTQEQMDFVDTFDAGYTAAMLIVRATAQGQQHD
jgi:hypothetical protein